MAVVVTGVALWDDGVALRAICSIVFSGTYPGAPGEPFNFKTSAIVRGAGKRAFDRIPFTQQQPVAVDVNGNAGFVYTYDNVNKTFRVWCNTAGGANNALGEHTNAAYVAGVTGDVIVAEVTVLKS